MAGEPRVALSLGRAQGGSRTRIPKEGILSPPRLPISPPELSCDVRTRTLRDVSSAIHISGIRVAHVEEPERGVRVNRPVSMEGPIAWAETAKLAGVQVRCGRGQSGLRYHVRKRGSSGPGASSAVGSGADWRVSVVTPRSELEIGSARMQDHALALAGMWEQAVLSGRIDMS
jgi:hypothetical protein